jgi:hypothetical protein
MSNRSMNYHLGITIGISDAQDGKPYSVPILLMGTDYSDGYAIGYHSEVSRV